MKAKFTLFFLLSFMLMTLAVFFVSCSKDSDDPIKDGNNSKPYFYVQYHGDHWATVQFDKFSTMTITDENGQEKSFSIGSRNVIIGPVYAGFKASMTISAPYDGGNNGSIAISRNSDHFFINYNSFANSKQTETLTYTILETTGL